MFKNGFTKAICPFGVFIAAVATYPETYMWYAANLVSNIMDQNNDGVADVPELANRVNHAYKWFMVGGDTAEQEAKGPALSDGTYFNGAFPLKVYMGNDNTDEVKKILEEEVMHFMTIVGWSPAFPTKLGVHDFTSLLC